MGPLSRHARVWLSSALALPLLTRSATTLADRPEARRGTRSTRVSRRAGRFTSKRGRPDRSSTLHTTAGLLHRRTG